MRDLRDIKPPYLEIIELIRSRRKMLLGKNGVTPISITELRQITSFQYINDCLKQLAMDGVISPTETLGEESEDIVNLECLITIEEIYNYRLSLQYEMDNIVTFPITNWESLEIRFITEQEVLLTSDDHGDIRRSQFAFSNLGFNDKRNGSPNQSWSFLTLLSIHDGILDTSSSTIDQKEQIKKEKQALKNHLQQIFMLDTDPFHPFRQNRQYELKCKIVPLS